MNLSRDYRLTPVGAIHAVMNRLFPGQVTMEMSRKAYLLLAEWAASEVMYEYETLNAPDAYAAIVFKGSGEVLGVMDKNEKTRRKKNAGVGRNKAA